MPLVYACICPPALPPDAPRLTEAAGRAAEELASYRPETLLLIAPPGATHRESMGLATSLDWPAVDPDPDLAERIEREAAAVDVPFAHAGHWRPDDGRGLLERAVQASGAARLLPVVCSWLDPRYHFDFGRAIGRALAGYEPRVAALCLAELSRAPGASGQRDQAAQLFDQQYLRAIEAWDVKWLLKLDPSFRKHASEGAVPQTAVLMGALSESRIQPRVLAYDDSGGAGRLVAAIDVLGPRRKRTEGSA